MAGWTARNRRWASVRAGRAKRERQAVLSGRGTQGVLGLTGRQAHGRWRASGSWARGRALGARQGAGRAAGRWARGRQALGERQAGAGRAAWAPGLALGSALGALGPFSIRFDSFFFFLSHQMNTVHCKIKFFRKRIK